MIIKLEVFVNPEVYYFVAILNLALGFHSNGHVQFHVSTIIQKRQNQKVSPVDLFGLTNQYSICMILFLFHSDSN